ncbi:MAG: hypothetical protein FVQ80_04095 [Planctomycetes bacterium]|nr:hypothetical protein [Planctomycetota bacterium]
MAKNEVKLIEKLAKNLQEWADNQSYTHSPTFIRSVPDFGQKEVILSLLTEKPMLGGKVQEDFKVLQEKVYILNSLSARPITENEYHEDFCPQVDEVKGIAADLTETLRYITVVKWYQTIWAKIIAGVFFLAALLTCIYLLWWLWTKFSE